MENELYKTVLEICSIGSLFISASTLLFYFFKILKQIEKNKWNIENLEEFKENIRNDLKANQNKIDNKIDELYDKLDKKYVTQNECNSRQKAIKEKIRE